MCVSVYPWQIEKKGEDKMGLVHCVGEGEGGRERERTGNSIMHTFTCTCSLASIQRQATAYYM